MSYKIISTPFFERKVKKLKKKYRNIKKDLYELVNILSINPKAGINLFDEIYKIRLQNSDIGGKRGGYRVIYYFMKNEEIYLLTIYSKKEKENISKNEILYILSQL